MSGPRFNPVWAALHPAGDTWHGIDAEGDSVSMTEQEYNESVRRGAVVGEPKERKRDDFLHGICVALTAVHGNGNGTLWAEIVRTANTTDILYYAAHIEPEEWELAGFEHWAWQELRERKPEAK